MKNNTDKFPSDFYFELNKDEFEILQSKISTANFAKNIAKSLRLDADKFNAQFSQRLTLKEFALCHDRFLIIDDEIYHFGASLKDLGKKWFAFSKMNDESLQILKRLEKESR